MNLFVASCLLWACIPVAPDDKIVTQAKVSDQTGKNRLLLRRIERDISENDKVQRIEHEFHSLVWETNDGNVWTQKRIIPKIDFDEEESRVDDLHSFDSSTGLAIIKVAGMSKPDESNSRKFIYAWYEWDIAKNKKVRLIRVCKNPMEPYEKRSELPKGVFKGNPVLDKALVDARSLSKQSKYEDALQKLIWIHENTPAKAPDMFSIRFSFPLYDWIELGEKYPKAKEVFFSIRDKQAKQLTESKGSYESFSDIASINRHYNQQDKTVELFKVIHDKRKDIAYFCYMVAEKDLADKHEYQLCSRYIKDPLQKLSQLTWMKSTNRNLMKIDSPGFADMADEMFVEDVCRLIEILAGSGRQEEALKVQAKAIAAIDTPEMRKATAKAIKGQSK